jgi:DNA helicase HerA-like ATPase
MDGSILPPQAEQLTGRIVSVSGSQIIALLQSGTERNPLHIGGLAKMRTPKSSVFGVVSGVNVPMPMADAPDRELQTVELELLGEIVDDDDVAGRFQRGVSVFPVLGDPVFTATPEDISRIYACVGRTSVRVGNIYQDTRIAAHVMVDELMGRHFAILGTTGSGKSCAVTVVLKRLLGAMPNAHMLLLDVHNEYSRAFGEMAEVLSPSSGLKLPYWIFNYEEIVEVLVTGEGEVRAVQASILAEMIPAARQQFAADKTRPLTVDTPVPYRMSDLIRLIEQPLTSLNKPENTEPYLRLVGRLKALQADPRFAFMFEGLSVRDNLADILSRLLRIPVDGHPLTIVDLSGVPSEIINVVVSVLCRLTFDFAVWSDRGMPILLVCEEAHRYVPEDPRLGFEPTKRAMSRIAKEGRKYGVALCVVSQRPSELASGLLSQCNTVFAMRMSTQRDQDFIRGTLADWATGLLDFLPSLRTGEAIAIGEGVPTPLRLRFDQLPEAERPKSGTAAFSEAWQSDSEDLEFVKAVVDRWRRRL